MTEGAIRAFASQAGRAAAVLGCPASGCGGVRFLQRGLTAAERAAVTADVWTMTGVANADNLARCGACGMVYERAIPPRLLGHLEEEEGLQLWRPLPSRY